MAWGKVAGRGRGFGRALKTSSCRDPLGLHTAG